MEGVFTLHGQEIDSYFGPANVMQPDFLFVSELAIVSIEMKVKAKSSIDQVMKYALLGLAAEKQQQKQHYLVILGRGTLHEQFKRKHFATVDDLRRELGNTDVDEFLSGKSKWRSRKERFCEILKNMTIEFWNYERFSKFLQDARPPDLDKSLGAEVCR